MATKVFSFEELSHADLLVDAVYLGGTHKNIGADPLSKLMRCGNQGGFRTAGGSPSKYVILYSSQTDRDWPDHLDTTTGIFTYYGDNKAPGSELHDTTRGGNRLLAEVFGRLHSAFEHRVQIPPFFVFTKAQSYGGRSVRFRGLAAPGAEGMSPTDDLVALWKSSRGERFQNYEATFTILDVPTVGRAWLEDLRAGNVLSRNCPGAWQEWVETGRHLPLVAPPSVQARTRDEQLPTTELEKEIVASIYRRFEEDPTAFEACAAEIVRFLEPKRYVVDEITRRSVDGGRDAIGRYRLGPVSDPITVDFALEAKCYRPELPGHAKSPSAVGVKEVARLISRLRHRQFGVLVTTSYVGDQAT